MEITNKMKERVVNALLSDMGQRNFPSQKEYARFISKLLCIPFDKSAMSQIKKPEGRKVITESSWLKLGKYFNVLNENTWNTAETDTYKAIKTALDLCKDNGIWQVLCDVAGIGKTYSAVEYAKQHKSSVIYLDCSECGRKTNDFIVDFARQFGLERETTYNRLWRDATDELLLLDNPLLILDEFGDVGDGVVELLKGLYNKADMGDCMALGVYFIGADNLQKRLEDGRKGKKPSYAELWSRFDNKITTLNFDRRPDNFKVGLKREIEKIVDKNLPEELEEKRDLIIEKCLNANGVRSIRKEIALQRKIKSMTK